MQRWTIQLEGGPRRVNHAAIAYGDSIFTFGGYCTGEDYTITRPMDTHRLNTGLYVGNIYILYYSKTCRFGGADWSRYFYDNVCTANFV